MKSLIYSKNRNHGISLVELLGVVSILGIIAVVGYGFFSNLSDSVRENKLSSEVATLNSAASTRRYKA
ncbi:MAG: type II secretion system protein [Verrucomicrobiales bacterium]